MKKNCYLPLTLGAALLILLLSALIASVSVDAQPTGLLNDRAKEPDEKIRLFFEDILADKPSKAFGDLLQTLSASEKTVDLKTKLEEVKNQFGTFRQYETIGTKSVGEDLVFLQYLLKCDRHPVVWTFTFYRRPVESGTMAASASPWLVIGLRFDSNLDPLLL